MPQRNNQKEPIAWHDFVAWIFFALLSYFAYDMNTTMKDMKKSVIELNKNVAVMVYQGSNHEDRLKKIESKLFR